MNFIKKVWHFLSDTGFMIANKMLAIFKKEISPEQWATLMQFVKFGMVGVMNTFIDYFAYLIALSIFNYFHLFGDKAYIPSNFIGLAASVSNAFYWNDKYVFKKSENEKRSKVRAFLKTFSSYALTGLVLKTICLYIMIDLLSISDIIAPIIFMFISVPLNFILNKLWAFRTK